MTQDQLSEHEYTVTVPGMYAPTLPTMDGQGEQAVKIGLSKLGGGTIGNTYSGSWEYAVEVNGVIVIEGNDLRSGALGATHAEMANTLANFLSATGESLHSAEMSGRESEYADEYDEDARAFLTSDYERLSLFAEGLI
jgi:hypothetical protein